MRVEGLICRSCCFRCVSVRRPCDDVAQFVMLVSNRLTSSVILS